MCIVAHYSAQASEKKLFKKRSFCYFLVRSAIPRCLPERLRVNNYLKI
jgi:hypothetical protein